MYFILKIEQNKKDDYKKIIEDIKEIKKELLLKKLFKEKKKLIKSAIDNYLDNEEAPYFYIENQLKEYKGFKTNNSSKSIHRIFNQNNFFELNIFPYKKVYFDIAGNILKIALPIELADHIKTLMEDFEINEVYKVEDINKDEFFFVEHVIFKSMNYHTYGKEFLSYLEDDKELEVKINSLFSMSIDELLIGVKK